MPPAPRATDQPGYAPVSSGTTQVARSESGVLELAEFAKTFARSGDGGRGLLRRWCAHRRTPKNRLIREMRTCSAAPLYRPFRAFSFPGSLRGPRALPMGYHVCAPSGHSRSRLDGLPSRRDITSQPRAAPWARGASRRTTALKGRHKDTPSRARICRTNRETVGSAGTLRVPCRSEPTCLSLQRRRAISS